MCISSADVMRIRLETKRREQRGLIGLTIVVTVILFVAAYVGHRAIVEREAFIDSMTASEAR